LLKLEDNLQRVEELKANLDFEVTEKIRLENKLHDLRDDFEKQLALKDLVRKFPRKKIKKNNKFWDLFF
jgi:hypothetical protein